jgi:GNAT superfamily N-acetyltransferase
MEIRQTTWAYWKSRFEVHHYLVMPPLPFGAAFVGFIDGEPVCHAGMTTINTGKGVLAARACRLVVAPEWQGAGVGMRFLNMLCQRESDGVGWAKRPVTTFFHTAHPALVAALRRSPLWEQTAQQAFGRKANLWTKPENPGYQRVNPGFFRPVTGWRYLGESSAPGKVEA